MATALVAAATTLARNAGAIEIEACPQALAPGERQAGAFVRTGVPSLFLAAGFQPVHAPPRGRGLYLLTLG